MLKKNLLFAAFLFCTGCVFAQKPCNCPEQFNWLQQKLALNYPGYRDKVTPQTQTEFERHSATFAAKIATAHTDTACFRLLTAWTRWFHDGHIQISNRTPPGPDDTAAIRLRFYDWEKINLNETEARRYLNQPGLAPVEGIYVNAEGNYRIALVRSPLPDRDYVGIVLQADSVWWLPTQVKFELKKNGPNRFSSYYYMRDHSMRKLPAILQGGVLSFNEIGSWYRQYPGPPEKPAPPEVFKLVQLDSQTLLLTLPTMNESVRKQLDKLIDKNKRLLETTPNLIIDCRNNGGGSDITFAPLKPYVYSGPVTAPRMQIYVTADNIGKYEAWQQDKNFPGSQRKQVGRFLRKMKQHPGEFYGECDPYSEKVNGLKTNPKKVVILINGRCASSCEQFVFFARQSKRVVLMGQATAGIFDYGNLHRLDFPGGMFSLAYPTSRSCGIAEGKGIDGKGIAPDVRIDDDRADWIELARQQFH